MCSNMNNKFYVIYAENYDNFRFYIFNTNPVMWTQDINNAKKYNSSNSAEFDILRDYDNYNEVKRLKENKNIATVYVSEYDNGDETRRVSIL